jgi:hypothetical protein
MLGTTEPYASVITHLNRNRVATTGKLQLCPFSTGNTLYTMFLIKEFTFWSWN